MKVSIIEAPKWIVKKMDNPSKVGDLVPLWLRKTPDESTLSMNPLPQIKISQPFKTIHAFAIPKNSSHSFEPFIWGYHKWGYPIDHPIFVGFSMKKPRHAGGQATTLGTQSLHLRLERLHKVLRPGHGWPMVKRSWEFLRYPQLFRWHRLIIVDQTSMVQDFW